MAFRIQKFLFVGVIFFVSLEGDLLAQSSQEVCARVLSLSRQNKKRLAHFVSRPSIREGHMTPDILSALTKLWVRRDQMRSEEIAKAMTERGVSREEANITYEIETLKIAESLYFDSIAERDRVLAENHRLQRARGTQEQSGLESANRAPADGYRVTFVRRVVENRDKAYKESHQYFDKFVENLRSKGPYDAVVTSRFNHQQTTGKYKSSRPGYTHYHSHLKRGQPTMVVGFWVNQDDPTDIIIDYWGTHEGVPWRK